ncbi:WGxxGxxG family protein [Aurantimonas sp. A2-1-M11]|uniref:WGxxGxxG family protein n=1 Tax=Aurantimonas sp. A2-1-M11 TaxID=3113712 RepID=UPI002F92F883
MCTNHLKVVALAAIILAANGTAALAQDTTTAPDTAVQQNYDDDGFDLGWLGLIGLAGLAGLKKRKHETHVVDTTRRPGI